MGNTDFRSLIEGDRRYGQDDDFGKHGYTEQEFQGEELVDVEEEPEEDDFSIDLMKLMTMHMMQITNRKGCQYARKY